MAQGRSRHKGTAGDATYRVGVLMGIGTGALVFLAGFVLCILGLTGAVELVIDGEGFSARILNASPGVVFALLGLGVMWKYKPKVEEMAITETVTADGVNVKETRIEYAKSSSAGTTEPVNDLRHRR